jgi:large subunit ribosomal protein L15
MPFYRRLPKKGFNRARFRTVYSIVNLKSLNGFPEGTRITPQLLKERRLVGSLRTPVKILGDGELTVRIDVVAHAFSQKAKEAIQRLGGTCEMIV